MMFSDAEVFLLDQTRQLRSRSEATVAGLMAHVSQARHVAHYNAAAVRRARETAAEAQGERAALAETVDNLLDENAALSAELVALQNEHMIALQLLRECLEDLDALEA